jgi:uncharacterized repeat protein (TIGR01451 family)
MFRKLLSNLPFNPSLINQVAFYARRMRREERLRRTGLIILVLAMLIQVFAVISPPEPTLAQSGNDIIEGGFATRDQAVLHCLNTERDFLKILQYYGIGCDTLAKAETVTLKSTDYEGKLDSLGRWPMGQRMPGTNKLTEQYEVFIPGSKTPLYMRNLWSWDSGNYSSYKFLRMKNKDGLIVMVMYRCGNIVTVDRYTPPTTTTTITTPKTPDLVIKKETSTNNMVKVGDDITYSLLYRNKGTASATNVVIKDFAPNNTDLVSVQPGGNDYKISSNGRGVEFWPKVSNKLLGYSDFYHVVKFTVRVTRYPSSGNSICNTGEIRSDQGSQESNEVCNYVHKPSTPTTPSVPTTPSIDFSTPPPVTPETPTSPSFALSKKAQNTTQNISDANGTTARAGDVIRYTLSVKNTGAAKAQDYVIEESLGDVLEYADIADLGGATIDIHKVVRWPKVDIPVGETLVRQLSVKIKNPLPSTPVSVSNPSSFDLTMTNVYGNAINIYLPGSVVKRTEQVANTLPNTGPGETLAVILGVVSFVGFFAARSRLIAKELDIVREDYAIGGGL